MVRRRLRKRYFYSDDLNSSMNSTDKAIEFYKKVKLRFLEGNFVVRKWRTNDEEARNYIHKQEDVKEFDTLGDKVLGIVWREKEDILIIDAKLSVQKAMHLTPTKRNVLKVIAGIYDPLGFIQIIIVRLKLLFQEICASKCGWDEEVNDDLKTKWNEVIKRIQKMPELTVQRAYCYHEIVDHIDRIEMHVFSEASLMAFGVCAYLKFTKRSGTSRVSFVASKSQLIAKNNTKNIHRLELLGIVG